MNDKESQGQSDPMLPPFGEDKVPSAEMIVEGKVGNGSNERFTSKLASTIQGERAVMKRELAAGRQDAYEEGMKDALGQIAFLETGIVEIGVSLLKRLELGDTLTRKELDTLKLAQQAAKEMKDRAMGKSKSTTEVTTTTSILALVAGIDLE